MNPLAPTPFLGFNGVYRGAVRYAAFSSGYGTDISATFRVSGDGQRWHKRGISGDILSPGGLFVPERMIVHGDKAILVGGVVGGGGAIFISDTNDGLTWTRVTTSIDGSGTTAFVDVASNGTIACAMTNTGFCVVSSTGESWSGAQSIGFSGSLAARCIAASSSVFVAGGTGGQIFSASNPSSTWTPRTSGFGATTIDCITAGNVFTAIGAGKISTSALTSGTSWTARTNPEAGGPFEWLHYADSRWLAGGFDNRLVTSTNGTTWSIPAKPDMLYSLAAIHDGDKWILLGIEAVVSEDGVSWGPVTTAGLGNVNYFAAAYLGS